MSQHDLCESVRSEEREAIAAAILLLIQPENGTVERYVGNRLIKACAAIARDPKVRANATRERQT